MNTFPARRPAAAVHQLESGLRRQALDHLEACRLRLTDEPHRAAAVLTSLAALRQGAGPQHMDGAVLIALTEQPPAAEDWRAALEAGARAVRTLPADSADLVADLSRLTNRPAAARVITVTGGCGGAGASSLAARLAGAAARTGTPVALVDADPYGGGLDLLIDAPQLHGAEWQDFTDVGAEAGDSIRQALPVIDGIHLLTGGSPDPDTVLRVVEALTAGDGLVVVDAPLEVMRALSAVATDPLVITPSTRHAAAAAERRLAVLNESGLRPSLAVRRRPELSPRDLTAQLNAPLAMVFRDSSAAVTPVLDRRRSGADAACHRWITTLLPKDGAR